MSEHVLPPGQYLFELLEYNTAPANQKAEVGERIEARQTQQFLDRHPEFYQSDYNASLISAWLEDHGGLPSLLWNLEICFNALKESGLLQIAPPAEQATVDRYASVTLSRQDTLAHHVPSDDEKTALSKLQDDSSLTDHARKQRDRKLKLLSDSQRRELAASNLYRD